MSTQDTLPDFLETSTDHTKVATLPERQTVLLLCTKCGKFTNPAYDREDFSKLPCWLCGEIGTIKAFVERDK